MACPGQPHDLVHVAEHPDVRLRAGATQDCGVAAGEVPHRIGVADGIRRSQREQLRVARSDSYERDQQGFSLVVRNSRAGRALGAEDQAPYQSLTVWISGTSSPNRIVATSLKRSGTAVTSSS